MEGPLDAEEPALAYFVVFDGEASSIFRPPPDEKLIIGRSDTADLSVESADVSRAHAEISRQGSRFVVTDLGSRNGSLVNGKKLSAPHLLSAGDVITLGKSCRLVFHASGSPPVLSNSTVRTFVLENAEIVVADPVMIEVYELVQRLAAASIPVLVHGETGTGKELVAGAVHQWSARKSGPFVTVNSAALPESLAESELFGAERGAYSGAHQTKIGLLESASGGTIFFDEVGELSLVVQAKLLRVLETKKVARLGEVREREVDIRIVAATNRDLAAECEAGRFRYDLYFRLSGATVWLPPLRERKHDLPVLVRALLNQACQSAQRAPMAISHGALDYLEGYRWPGNIRELKNILEYVVATVPSATIEREHLQKRIEGKVTVPPDRSEAPIEFRPIEEELRELECNRMLAALRVSKGNQTAAADLLRMPRRTFVAKMKTHDLREKLRRA